jgi:hypothetical protein
MNKRFIKGKKKKKNIVIRFMEWIIQGNKRAAEKGTLCKS